MAVEVQLATSNVRIIIDPLKMAELLRGEQGPVFRHMVRVGDKVVTEAKRRVGVSKAPPTQFRKRGSGGRFTGRTTPHMRDTIVKRVGTIGNVVVVTVGTDAKYALYHHEGTPAHDIVGNPLLVFYWERVGAVVAFRKVHHPGTQPNRFLTEAAEAVVPHS